MQKKNNYFAYERGFVGNNRLLQVENTVTGCQRFHIFVWIAELLWKARKRGEFLHFYFRLVFFIIWPKRKREMKISQKAVFLL